MAKLRRERTHALPGKPDASYQNPIRNRHDSFEFHADRYLIQEELHTIWEKQKAYSGSLSLLLSDDLKSRLGRASDSATWRHEGAIFGQRRTYWNVGTLGRCDLEPTDRCAPLADRWASYFRVVESVNNIRLEERGRAIRPLTPGERQQVIDALQSQQKGTVATVRRALGIHTKEAKGRVFLNIERDRDREINTDWFYREISLGAFGAERWAQMTEQQREAVNRAILRHEPNDPQAEAGLRGIAGQWWEFSEAEADQLIAAWKSRPNLEKRVKLSRRAIQNLLPYMEEQDTEGRWPTQIEARRRFFKDTGNDASPKQRERYAVGLRHLNKAERHFLRKHPDRLLPPPFMANPVVRKAIHEVRDHVEAHLRAAGQCPDRVIIELARETRQTARDASKVLSQNRKRENIRKQIIEDYDLGGLSENQQRRAVDRAVLCRQQKSVCAYSGKSITDDQAAGGEGLEVDHIIPRGRSWDNGLANRVLCYRDANRDKSNRTPCEWLGADSQGYQNLLSRFRHLESAEIPKDNYFTKHDAGRKWENLTREIRDDEAWRPDQLAATGYAARQVGQYLQQALWPDETPPEAGGKQRVFFTKGKYTAMLRRDWQLFETPDGETREDGASVGSRSSKDRSDHRHHALDALVIALTDTTRLQRLARTYREQLEEKARTGHWPERQPLAPPWGTIKLFRRQILSEIYGERSESGYRGGQIVFHYPQRRLQGALHEESLFGPVLDENGLPQKFAIGRKPVAELDKIHLRMPEGWEELTSQRQNTNLSSVERAELRKRVAVLDDPSPGKSGIVRDRDLRARIRQCVRKAGLDPDSVTRKQMAQLVEEKRILQASDMPIRCIRLLRANRNPVVVKRRQWDSAQRKYVPDTEPRSARVYVGGNNHHVEIREDEKTGKWTVGKGGMVDMFEAAKRNQKDMPLVDRSDWPDKRFVMSIHIGEILELSTVRAVENGDRVPEYWVVAKLNRDGENVSLELVRHNDARDSKEREILKLSPSQLQKAGLTAGAPARKVRVGPLGDIRVLERD